MEFRNSDIYIIASRIHINSLGPNKGRDMFEVKSAHGHLSFSNGFG